MNDVACFTPTLDGLVPESLAVRTIKIHLDSLEVMADIGFHEFEIGAPQRLLITAEVWLNDDYRPSGDQAAAAWNYDFLRIEIERLAQSRRFNLQETLVAEIYDWVAARRGVKALRIASRKPDVYANARGVGVEIASFSGAAP